MSAELAVLRLSWNLPLQLDGHMDYKTSCQEYKDCPGACQDQACKDLCALKTCYYYHCDTYKNCWDACADQGCRDQCSYKGCSYGLTDGLQGAIAKVGMVNQPLQCPENL